ncbi:MAG: Glu-tRNA(Gln) amidotransferase subunit GatE [Nanobdellota archaeon]
MSDKKIKAGIEIHAQLDGKKLFCECPTLIREDKPDYTVKRRLKAVVGETGEIDVAAAKEQSKKKDFVYYGYDDTTCLVELDEEPPHIMNEGALNLSLQMCKFLNCRPVDEIQIMRKTVIDGSNTTGFQRTSLIGTAGFIDIENKKISVDTLCLEEDACKIIERKNEQDIYNLSRLGIPLIEIATGPDLESPEEVKKAAEKIGMFIRSLKSYKGQRVKRGIGTIRQDVNVSIEEGERVEIKGAQDLKMIPEIVRNEAKRQSVLINLKDKVFKCGKTLDITDSFKKTSCGMINKKISKGGCVIGFKVKGMKGFLGIETMKGRRVGSEISDYAKIAGVGGIIHSDEDMSKYNLEEKQIRDNLSIEKDDAFILIADDKTKAMRSAEYAKERIYSLKEGVIKEVRKANSDGTTSYMRPMPGGARMYPETDTLPIKPYFDEINMGESIEDKIEDYIKLGIKNKNLAKTIARDYAEIFDSLKEKNDANFLASCITAGAKIIEPDKEIYSKVLEEINKGNIPKNSFTEVLDLYKSGKSLDEAINSKKTIPEDKLSKIVDEAIKKIGAKDMKDMGKIMGEVMKNSGGKADGKKASEMIKKRLS